MKSFGYTVGSVNGEPRRVRRHILIELFRGAVPTAFPLDYLQGWGEPSSTSRLRKMAEAIAGLTRNAKRQQGLRMAAAIEDWEADLDFLYQEIYVGRFGFQWPSTILAR
ncbi:hypothetical protein [Methyloceanibacter methanicus]|uniref:hypothetical protein n=1 Tax=Methyloceanibacter methanicus TaxID=1774968 RepID=UPI00130118FC|nr:hypothetical protein [Methyloceanibacter methanicus]